MIHDSYFKFIRVTLCNRISFPPEIDNPTRVAEESNAPSLVFFYVRNSSVQLNGKL